MHLNLPENQFDSDLAVLKWDGRWPKIAKNRLQSLNDLGNLGLAITLLLEHQTRAQGKEEIE